MKIENIDIEATVEKARWLVYQYYAEYKKITIEVDAPEIFWL